ncbi:hypothetical protein AGMMS49983_12540 [Clostridia bacterium]|nr:hypothetical protein AGMMS49983_12540 [Clostridia bacterium]
MRKTMRARTFPILLTLMMVLAMVPATAFADPVAIEQGATSATQSVYGVSAGNVVYFGSYPQSAYTPTTLPGTPTVNTTYTDADGTQFVYSGSSSYYKIEPIAWRVLSNDGTNLFLLADKNLDTDIRYNNTYTGVTWETCTLRTWLNGTFYNQAFNAEEQAAITTTDVVNGATSNPSYPALGGADTQDKVFLLSVAEVQDATYGFANDQSRVALNTAYTAYKPSMSSAGSADYWWLRSPGDDANYAALVSDAGFVYDIGDGVSNNKRAVRPALNLNLSSVIFTSAASGAGEKSNATANSTLTAVSVPSDSIKFTMKDNSVAPGFTASATARSGDTYTITYANAATDANKSISAIVMRGGVMTHYGQLVHPASASGTTTVALPTGFDPATDTLKVFAEELNGDDYTDFATTPITIDTTAPMLSAESAIRTSETAATVKFTSNEAGQYYYEVVESGAGTPSIDTSVTGVSCDTTEQTIAPALSGNSAKDIYIVVKDAVGNVSAGTFKIVIPAYVPVDKTALNAALTNANAILHGGVNTTQAWTNFENARTAAADILNQTSPPATQAEIDTATANLEAAISALKASDNSFGFENGANRYTIGSGVNLVHSATRDWALHTGLVYVDGQRVTHGTHYTSAAGSTRTTLHASYLDTLSVGQHTLTVEFSPGIAPIVDTFYVAAAVPAGEGGGGAPATGDDSNMAVLWVALLCAALGMLCLIVWRKRQRMAAGK